MTLDLHDAPCLVAHSPPGTEGALPAEAGTGLPPAERIPAVQRAVGDHFGIRVDRHQVGQGLLPAVTLPLDRWRAQHGPPCAVYRAT